MITRPWDENIWFSPPYVIEELDKEASRGNKNLKRFKEAWICAVMIICHAKFEPAEWWIQVPKKDPPDVLAMKVIPHSNGRGQNLFMLQVEVFEISAFDDEAIEKSIERKLTNQDYSGMAVVGFVRRKRLFDHEYVANYIKNLKPNVAAIFLLVREEGGTNISYIQIFPECIKYKEDFGLICKRSKQRVFTKVRRGTIADKKNHTTTDRLTLVP